MLIINTHALLQSVNLQSWWKRLGEFLGLVSVVHNQSVLVSGPSNLEFGLSEFLAGSVDFRVGLDGGGLDVGPSGKLNKLLDVDDFSSHCICIGVHRQVKNRALGAEKSSWCGGVFFPMLYPLSPKCAHVTPDHHVQKANPNQQGYS